MITVTVEVGYKMGKFCFGGVGWGFKESMELEENCGKFQPNAEREREREIGRNHGEILKYYKKKKKKRRSHLLWKLDLKWGIFWWVKESVDLEENCGKFQRNAERERER